MTDRRRGERRSSVTTGTARRGPAWSVATGLLIGAAVLFSVPLVPAEGSPSHAPDATAFEAASVLHGPVTTGHLIEPATPVAFDLSQYGYTESEYFASGTAYRLRAVQEPSDGRWKVRPSSPAAYETRLVVRYPTDAARFNGTVIVEWLNVSGGVETALDWDYLNPELMQQGFAYVAVSAQSLGIEGGPSVLHPLAKAGQGGLVQSEPQRYGSLHHPGDRYALDIYAQVGRALENPANRGVFGGLAVRHVIADGESQSAFYLTTFADALQPVTHAYGGFFVHSRGGSGAGLNGIAVGKTHTPAVVHIRSDFHVPVLQFETQTDLVALTFAGSQQPDTRWLRTWEVAGTSHVDAYAVGSYAASLGCTAPINAGPQHEIIQAALVAYQRWLTTGDPPPPAPRFDLASINPPRLATDHLGNVLGGIRSPAVDVPVSTLSGAAPPHEKGICTLLGSTKAFSKAKLGDLYSSEANFIDEYTRDLDRTINAGYILESDRTALLQLAATEWQQAPEG